MKKTSISFILIFSTLLMCINAQAGTDPIYRAHQDNSRLGPSEWYVSKGKNGHRIYFSTEKQAQKAAKKLRKIDKKDNKVWDDGSGLCDQPGVNC